MKIAIITGSVRNNRDGSRVVKFTEKVARERGWEVTTIDPSVIELPLLQEMYKQMKEPAEKFSYIHNTFNDADGFIIVSAEYNHSVPPALKNLLDHFREEYFFKTSAIISYSSGPFGGVRAVEHLRAICSELRMPSIPTAMSVSKVHESIDENGDSVNGDYERRSKRFLDEFQWFLEAMKTQREKWRPY